MSRRDWPSLFVLLLLLPQAALGEPSGDIVSMFETFLRRWRVPLSRILNILK